MNAGERFNWEGTIRGRSAPPALKIVLVYENALAAERAVRMLELPAREFNGRLAFTPSLWRFDLLADSALRARATEQVLDADLILLASNAGCDVPASLQTWLRACLAQKKNSGAAVAVLRTSGKPVANDVCWLNQAAMDSHLDFLGSFPTCSEKQDAHGSHSLPDEKDNLHEKPESAGALDHIPATLLSRSIEQGAAYHHWGINE